MSLHGLLSVAIGVPNAAETAQYYADFGLAPDAEACRRTACWDCCATFVRMRTLQAIRPGRVTTGHARR
jgi:hypothetical protein